METLILVVGITLVIVAFIRNRNRADQHGSHYHGGMYHSHSDQSSDARHGGDWGGRDMSHDHHDSSSGGWGGDAADGGGGGGGDGGGGGE